MAEGSLLCGFGKAEFMECPVDLSTLDPDTQIMFDCTGDTFASIDKEITGSMQEILTYAKEKKPSNCKICYHTATTEPDGTWIIKKEGCGNSILYYIYLALFFV
jgi:hypothetical protein